jgi:hypothetical protein
MSEVESLLKAYERFVRLPWDDSVAGPQKVRFAIYDPSQERRLRPRIGAFEAATRAAGHGWILIDLTGTFAEWMARHEYREEYFKQPEDMALALTDFADFVGQQVEKKLCAPEADEQTVVAIVGLASLFGLARASELFPKVAPHIKGRLLAFFPGQHDGSNYRLLDARDGWNYLAVPISAASGGG